MRDVHFCKTCDFRLPFCVRTDREFCGKRCRVWWYRHPGIKRLDFSPGDEIPARRKNGQPKTLAEALVLLEAERARAADLEDAAKRAQTQEGVLRNELTALRDELTEERTSLATLRDELSDERKKQTETDLLWRKAEERADEMEASYNSLADDLEKAEEYTSVNSIAGVSTGRKPKRSKLRRMRSSVLWNAICSSGNSSSTPGMVRGLVRLMGAARGSPEDREG